MARVIGAAAVLLAFAMCSSATAPSQGADATITFTSSGVTPTEVTVNRTGRVTFVNGDTRLHRTASDPHPDHNTCPELNVGGLDPGARLQSGSMTAARDCRFHDDASLGDERFSGRVLVGLQ